MSFAMKFKILFIYFNSYFKLVVVILLWNTTKCFSGEKGVSHTVVKPLDVTRTMTGRKKKIIWNGKIAKITYVWVW